MFVKYWLLVLVWMSLIFTASGDPGSSQRSSRIIGPLLHWLFPHLSGENVNLIVFAVRKCAHLAEFAVLALLIWRALRKPMKRDSRPWSWVEARLVILLVALYATSDEFHQLFVPSRDATMRDVMIDTAGGILGLLFLWAIGRWRRHW